MDSKSLPSGRDMFSILGMDFFKEEKRCDYLITEKSKKIWAINIDLYLEFSKICNKYNLNYFAYAGTLLGAIRHKGFIPWDDDMDVCMPRKDYEEFIRVAPHELSDPYFLQTVHSDKQYYRTIIRLVNKETTCLPVAFMHSDAINGIPLDIFPLDEFHLDTHEHDIALIRESAIRCSSFMKRNDTDKMTQEQYEKWLTTMTDNPFGEWEKVQKVATMYNSVESGLCCMKVFVINGSNYNNPLKKDWFGSHKTVMFENIEIRIPSYYDEILKATYGDYMKFPPIEKRGNWHSGVIVDPDKCFLDYVL